MKMSKDKNKTTQAQEIEALSNVFMTEDVLGGDYESDSFDMDFSLGGTPEDIPMFDESFEHFDVSGLGHAQSIPVEIDGFLQEEPEQDLSWAELSVDSFSGMEDLEEEIPQELDGIWDTPENSHMYDWSEMKAQQPPVEVKKPLDKQEFQARVRKAMRSSAMGMDIKEVLSQMFPENCHLKK